MRQYSFIIFLLLASSSILTGTVEDVGRHNTILRPEKEMELDAFSFAVLSDTHIGGDAGAGVFKAIVKEINRLEPLFVVHLGDSIHSHGDPDVVAARYDEFSDIAALLSAEVRHVPGNHEIAGSKAREEIYVERFGPLYYSFVRNGCLFIVINTETVGREGIIGGEQLAWLERELDKSGDYKYIFVFAHRPMFSVLSPGKDYIHFISPDNRDNIQNLFLQNGVTAFFAGHEHLHHSGDWDGLRQVITGGGGGRFHFFGGFYHFLHIEVSGGLVEIQAVRVYPQGIE